MSKRLIMLVGPAGAGKSTYARKLVDVTYINQDIQGREHLHLFDMAILAGEDVVIDRMNFTKGQRSRYLDLAKKHGYHTTIVVLHESYETCLARCLERKGHETITEEKHARGALNMFYSKYERVEDGEADFVERIWPSGLKPMAIICDLDGTLCNVEHRLHFVRKPKEEKKDWAGFFRGIEGDSINAWCKEILAFSGSRYRIVLCSGRPDNYKRETTNWLAKYGIVYDDLFMRLRNDSRQDNITKEVILDFEILTRYTPHYMIDDRQQVVDMWRKRGYTCLQCAHGDF